jgi:hypothetical protein
MRLHIVIALSNASVIDVPTCRVQLHRQDSHPRELKHSAPCDHRRSKKTAEEIHNDHCRSKKIAEEIPHGQASCSQAVAQGGEAVEARWH